MYALAQNPTEPGIWDSDCRKDMFDCQSKTFSTLQEIELTAPIATRVPYLAFTGPPTSLFTLALTSIEPFGPTNSSVSLSPPFDFSIAQGMGQSWTDVPGATGVYTPAVPGILTGILVQVSGIWGTTWRVDLGLATKSPAPAPNNARIRLRVIVTRSTAAVTAPAVWRNPKLVV